MALEKQMELFDNGSLMQEGGQVDEESGNEVPIGSTKEEVRDDIPAQLSEGEFVMPADAVRYHGLDKMMELRQEAKIGLKRMEQMGMMGNSDEATLPDDIPFDVNDLDMEDDGQEQLNFNVGGFVQPPFGVNMTGGSNVGGFQPSQFANFQPSYTSYQALAPMYSTPTAGMPPQQANVPTTTAPSPLPSFQSFVSPNYVTYVNPQTGATIQIPVDANGNPLIPVPAGFVKQSAQAQQPAAPDPNQGAGTGTTQQQQQISDEPSEFDLQQEAAQRQLVSDRKAAAKELGYTKTQNLGDALLGITPFGFIAGNPEAGTILGDGTIADGQGNSFDPISGKQVGFTGGLIGNIAGGLGFRETEAEKFGLPEGSQIPEASLAGLKSQMGEAGIRDAIEGKQSQAVQDSIAKGLASEITPEMIDSAVKAGLGTREEILANIEATKPGTARVETTLGKSSVTNVTPKTVTEAAASATTAAKGAPTKSFDELVEERIAEYTAKSPSTSPEQIRAAAISDVKFDQTVAAMAEAGTLKSNMRKAFSTPLTTDEITIADIKAREAAAKTAAAQRAAGEVRASFPTRSDSRAATAARTSAREAARIDRQERGIFDDDEKSLSDLISEAARSSNRRDREDIQAKIAQEMTGRSGYNKQYERDIRAGRYDDAFNSRDDFNREVTEQIQKEEREEIKQAKAEGRRANVGSRPAGTGEVSDSSGNVVRSSDGTPVTSISRSTAKGRALAAEREQREAENATDTRVICTELYRQGKLSRELYRMDVMYTARYLSPTVVKGYHYWAIPVVQKMRKSDKLTKFMLYFTMKRAEEIAHIVNPAKYPKSSIAGKIIKNVGEALCYGIGLFVNNSDYKVLYKGEKTC